MARGDDPIRRCWQRVVRAAEKLLEQLFLVDNDLPVSIRLLLVMMIALTAWLVGDLLNI